MKTSFDTGVLLIHFLHKFHIIFFLVEQHSYFFGNKKIKYAENAPLVLHFIIITYEKHNHTESRIFFKNKYEMPTVKIYNNNTFRMKLTG